MTYIDNDFFDLMRVWASITENLLAFDAASVDAFYKVAKEKAADGALWPPDDRERAREAAHNGDLMRTFFIAPTVETVLTQQRALLDARADLDAAESDDDTPS